MSNDLWQIKARLPANLRESMHLIASENDRSINYMLVKAISEFVVKYSEAPTAVTVRASVCPIPAKE